MNMPTEHKAACRSGDTWRFRIAKEDTRNGIDYVAFAETYEGAGHTAQRMANSYREPMIVWPCLHCVALIGDWITDPDNKDTRPIGTIP